jgi:putative ABC transport system substrate-binding protein
MRPDRTATYVDRILRGAKPGDLPVQFSDQVRDGREPHDRQGLGLAIPPSIRLRATEVIK